MVMPYQKYASFFLAIGLSAFTMLSVFGLGHKERPSLSSFDPLKEAFSQGILNPKIYNQAHI